MGLMDDLLGVAGQALQQQAGQGGQDPRAQLAGSVLGMIQQGGLDGLLNSFRGQGLGDAVSSWISTGQNLPVSGSQVASALGQQQLSSIAQKVGLPVGQVADGLSQVLPAVVDRLTPNGTMPDGSSLQAALAAFLK